MWGGSLKNLVFRGFLYCVNADLPLILAGRLEFYLAVNLGEQSKITSAADIIAGQCMGAGLAYDYSTGINSFASVAFYATHLGLGITAVAR